MVTPNSVESRLEQAHSNFEPIRRFLAHLSKLIERKSHRQVTLEPRQDLHKTAQNVYEVQYFLHRSSGDQMLLNFILTGDKTDLVLVQDNQPPSLESPGQFDQRVYHLDEMDTLKAAVREKVVSHLRAAA